MAVGGGGANPPWSPGTRRARRRLQQPLLDVRPIATGAHSPLNARMCLNRPSTSTDSRVFRFVCLHSPQQYSRVLPDAAAVAALATYFLDVRSRPSRLLVYARVTPSQLTYAC